MKKYIDYLNEFTADEILKGLLAFGMFNTKLPKVFTSEPFYNFCIKNNILPNREPHDWIRYDNNRNNQLPRQLGIPNPFAYYLQCLEIKNNWNDLLLHFDSITNIGLDYKISRIHIRKLKSKNEIFEMTYNNYIKDAPNEPTKILGTKFVANADISNCFNDIYTHCIAWAILGKDAAKVIKGDHSHYVNKLDTATGNTTYGETHGILIGPVTSNLISEIVLCKIDKELIEKGYRFTRYIDDYKCYAESYDRGKMFIEDLRKVLLKYDLSINEKKSKIVPINACVEENLNLRIHQLNYLLDCKVPYNKITYKQLVSYLDALNKVYIDLDNNLSVYSYAMKILASKEMSINASKYYVDKVLSLSLNNPYLLSYVKEYVFDVFGVTESFSEYCGRLYNSGISEGNYEKSVYGLYFAIVNGFKISLDNENDFLKNAKESNDCLFRLFSAFYCSKNKILIDDFYDYAKTLSVDDSEFDRNWLFVYEVLKAKDLKGNWKTIKKSGVSFLNKKAFTLKKHWKTLLY